MFYTSRNVVLLLSGLLTLGACKLVDQRTFNPSAGKRPIPYVPPAPPAPPPLAPPIEIMAGTPVDQWQEPVAILVKDALSRKADALFMVTVLLPASTSDGQHEQEVKDALQQEKDVANTILKAGAPQEQVQLAAKMDGGIQKSKIQVTIR